MARVFGHIPGCPPGSTFENRLHLSQAGVHRPTQAGIRGSAHEGADSIVLSGGYEDDEDEGSVVLYTGAGGRDLMSKEQIADQRLQRSNLALAKNKAEGLPVRVVRGATHPSPYAPPYGYRYDGLYDVESYWSARGQAGFLVWRFRLVQRGEPAIWFPASAENAFPL